MLGSGEGVAYAKSRQAAPAHKIRARLAKIYGMLLNLSHACNHERPRKRLVPCRTEPHEKPSPSHFPGDCRVEPLNLSIVHMFRKTLFSFERCRRANKNAGKGGLSNESG